MHATVLGLVVASLAPAASVAAPVPSVPPIIGAPSGAPSADEGWQGLDQEIARLASSYEGDSTLRVSGWTEILVSHSSDPMFQPSPGVDLSGFEITSARVQANASVGQYDVEVSAELTDPDPIILDAFATVPLFGNSSLEVGQFRPPTLYSALIYEKNTLFAERTLLGGSLDDRDTGVMFVGGAGPVDLYVALQNGGDGAESEYRYTVRGTYDFFGNAFGPSEGAWGYSGGTHLSAGAAAQKDSGILNGWLIAGDAALIHGPLSLYFEIVQYDEMYDASILHPVTGTSVANTNPFGFSFGYLLGDTPWEFVARYEGIDDPLSTTKTSYGFNYYSERGHDAKWQLAVENFQSDAVNSDSTLITFGVTVGI